MKLKIPEFISSIKPYEPGKPIDELEREYGIKNSIKLASNENPLGVSPMALRAVSKALENLNRYPEGGGHYLVNKLSEKLHVKADNIVLGNGSDEIIGMLTKAFLRPKDQAVIPAPSFLMYEIMVRASGALPVFVPVDASLSIDLLGMKEKINEKTGMIFLTQPNNPTGKAIYASEFAEFVKTVPPETIIVVDEAYIEFMRDKKAFNSLDFFKSDRIIVTLRTFSKAYGLAGLRIGYGVMPGQVAEILHRIRQPFNTNSLAQAAAVAALDDEEFLSKTLHLVHSGLEYLYKELAGLGIKFFKTQANFMLIDVQTNADGVFEMLLKEGVIVRSMTSYGYPEYIRVNAGLPAENERFIEALKKVLNKMS